MNREDLTLGIVSFPDDPDSSMATSQTSDTMRVVVEPHPYDIAAVASRSSHTEWNDDVFRLLRTCRKLLAKGADAILLSGASARSVAVALETELDMPVSDMRTVDAFCNGGALTDVSGDPRRHYARWARRALASRANSRFRLGIVGGIGPAATVDFMAKVVRHTPASTDQAHVRMLVDHNPQIPDRTAHLLHNGDDPSLALFSACVRLEEGGASAIALPCNTAHAFVARIQPHLGVPIVNMLDETVRCIVSRFGIGSCVGLLATSGTIESFVYHDAADARLTLITPDEQFQQCVMQAIYGPQGVKAGFTEGACRTELDAAIAHLVARGAQVVVLGCTELPLVLGEQDAYIVNGTTVAIVDPTSILARHCVRLAMKESK